MAGTELISAGRLSHRLLAQGEVDRYLAARQQDFEAQREASRSDRNCRRFSRQF